MCKKIVRITSGIIVAFGLFLVLGIAGGSDLDKLSIGQTLFGELIGLLVIAIGGLGLRITEV